MVTVKSVAESGTWQELQSQEIMVALDIIGNVKSATISLTQQETLDKGLTTSTLCDIIKEKKR
jgi:hypothetical protein